MDFQDYVSPVFRLDLLLARDDGDEGRSKDSSRLKFSRSDDEILAGFAAHVDRLVSAFDDFCRPEFCKVSEKRTAQPIGVNGKDPKPEGTIKGKTDANQGVSAYSTGQDIGTGSHSCGVQQDFESLLYPGEDSGSDFYSRFIGRVQVLESDRATKGHRIEYDRTASVFGRLGEANQPPTYIDRFFKVAHAGEACYRRAKQDILAIVRAHLQDNKRVLEIYQQFELVLEGKLAQRVTLTLAKVQEDGLTGQAADKEYAAAIKEVRFYQKLSRQLPTIVFLPMFEVGVRCVKDELQRRLDCLLDRIFDHYEARVMAAARALCSKYNSIC